MAELAVFWGRQLKGAKKEFDRWEKDAKDAIKRYRDESELISDYDGNGAAKFNVLWSNTQVLHPALYSRTPKAEIERRNKDSDKIARLASEVWQRAVEYSIAEYAFDEVINGGVFDLLLPGRGVARVAYEAEFETVEAQPIPVIAQKGKLFGQDGAPVKAKPDDVIQTPEGFAVKQYVERVAKEKALCKYVHWSDFCHTPTRMWSAVWWVAFRSHLDREELTEKFGEEVATEVPYSSMPKGADEAESRSDSKEGKCAEVWEIWDKRKKHVVYLVKGYDKAVQVKPDPLGLDDFFPCGRPLLANISTDSLKPRPDFAMYRDQARELDELTMRISLLTSSLRVVGVYDSSMEALARITSEATENKMIPVDAWAMLADKGGLKGVMDFFPMEQVAEVLTRLYDARDRTLQSIYELTGISDIVRGASDPGDTATAQQIKGQFATLRISSRQQAVQEWIRDLISRKAEIIAEHFAPETIRMISGYDGLAGANPQDPQEFEAIIQLLRNDPLRRYRIAIETDSTLAVNDQAEKQRVNEYIQVVGQFLSNSLPLAAQVPEMAPYLGETLKFVARRYRAGRQMEERLEQGIDALIQKASQPPPPPPPDPRIAAEQAKAQLEQQKLQFEAQKFQVETQLEEQRMDKEQRFAVEKMAMEMEKIRAEMQLKLAEISSTQQQQYAVQAEKAAAASASAPAAPAAQPSVINVTLPNANKRIVLGPLDPVTGARQGAVISESDDG
jgi:hypothetical protein